MGQHIPFQTRPRRFSMLQLNPSNFLTIYGVVRNTSILNPSIFCVLVLRWSWRYGVVRNTRILNPSNFLCFGTVVVGHFVCPWHHNTCHNFIRTLWSIFCLVGLFYTLDHMLPVLWMSKKLDKKTLVYMSLFCMLTKSLHEKSVFVCRL